MARWSANKVILLLGAALIALAALINVVLVPDQVGMLAPLFPGIVVAIVLIFWERPWLYLVAGIVAAAFPLLISLVFAWGAISHPGGGIDTLSVVFLLAGGILALVGGVMGFVEGIRKDHARPSRGIAAPQSLLALLVVGALLGYAAANGFATDEMRALTELPTHHADSVDAHVQLFASGIAYAPKAITIQAGELTSIDVENRDPVVHTFSYHLADGNHEQPLLPGSKVSILMKLDAPQVLHVWCAPHSGGESDRSDDGMWVDVTVA